MLILSSLLENRGLGVQQCGYSNSRPSQDTHTVGCCQWLVKALVALAVSRWWWCSSSWCTSAGPSNQQSMKLCLLNLTVARNTPPAIHWHGNTECAPPHLWSSIRLCPCLRLAEKECLKEVANRSNLNFAPKKVNIFLVTVFGPFTENCCAIKSDRVQISYARYLLPIILPFSGMKPETDRESTRCWWLLERYPTMALCAEDELRITGVCLYCDSA